MGRTKGSKNKSTGKRFKKSEGRYPSDKHIRLTKDMLMDERFLALSGNAVRLYLYLRKWAEGREDVVFSASMASKFMKKHAYIRSRDELEKAGFIDYVNRHCARDKREAAIFEFSDRWQWENRSPVIKPPAVSR